MKSDRWIAERCGVSDRFVNGQRPEVRTVRTSQEPSRTGKDGKSYPARKPPTAPKPSLSVVPSGGALPRTRAECIDGPRPCPHVRCRYSLPRGTCALDVAARGEHTLEEVASHFGFTRERCRQVQESALSKLRASGVDLAALMPEPVPHPDAPSYLVAT